MLVAQLFVLWEFVEGCYAEYTLTADVSARALLSRLDWLKPTLWHQRWMVGYCATTLGLLLVISIGLLVVAILRSRRREENPS